MKYYELKISTDIAHSEIVQAALIEAGFISMQIDDPRDAADIAAHPEIYKYDYINEEILQKAAGASSEGKILQREAGASYEEEILQKAAGASSEEEILQQKAGMASEGKPAKSGLDVEDSFDGGADEIIITLYFTEDEEGQCRLAEAGSLLQSINREISSHDIHAVPRHAADADAATTEIHTEQIVRFQAALTGDDSEWLYKWQENFKPTKVGSRIVVKPGWEDYEQEDGELVIEMEPGMAFGSGLHETTSMCIKAIEKAFSGEYGDCQHTDDHFHCGLKLLDVGTGTGILAIAAALLGAEDCLGIDIDDEAVRVGNENVTRNRLEERIRIAKGDLMEGVDYEPDIIAANLMADLVMKLAPAGASQLRPGGIFISSGILDIKEDAVAEAILKAGFEIKEIMRDGEWRAITAIRK